MKVQHIIGRVKQRVQQFLYLDKNGTELAVTCCIGIYIAFSPFIGLHTAMAFLFSWLLGINCAVVLTVSMVINNPWTMVPVYGAGYFFGDWLLAFNTINHHAYNPTWIAAVTSWLKYYVPVDGFSFWAFMLGGNVLGVMLALLCYPFIKKLIYMAANKHHVLRTVVHSKRAVASLKAKAVPMMAQVARKSHLQRTLYETGSSK